MPACRRGDAYEYEEPGCGQKRQVHGTAHAITPPFVGLAGKIPHDREESGWER
jgi:hypothetical protein